MIYIGIDFGHGETTVSRVPGCNGSPVSQIALTNTNNAADKKIKSAVCKKNDKWSLVYRPDDYRSADLREGFKAMVKGPDNCEYRVMSPKDRESMREFARLVFDTILRYDGELKYNSFEDRNFVLGIACPSGWVNEHPDAQREYLDFFRNECGLPVDICIKESDAAFFTKFYNQQYNVNDRVFVIDLGSSTIDFTTYSGGKCISDLCWGECLGAHLIDDLLVNAIINEGDNAANIAKLNAHRQQFGLGNCDSALSLYTRDYKEGVYTRADCTNEDPVHSVRIGYDNLTVNWTGGIWDDCVRYSVTDSVFQNIVRSYMDRMRDTLQNAKIILKQHGITPNKVLLSGGACNMPFVQEYAREIFADAEVYKDPQPECVVSNGVALYAKQYTESWNSICVAINAFDFENSYKEADRAATKRATEELFPAVLDTIKGTRDMTCKEISDKIAMFFLGLTPANKEYSEMLNTSINTSINAWARTKIKTILETAFKVSIKEADINIVVKTVVMCYPKKFFDKDHAGYLKLYNLMEEATGGLIGHIWAFDYDEKERDFSDRYDIAQKCEEQLCVGDPFGIGYNPGHLNMICTDIKDQCIEEARKIFETNQLFESKFKQ